jgi:DNA-binding NtrC family response regulator
MNIAIIDDQENIRYTVSKILHKQKHKTFEYNGLEKNLATFIEADKIDLLIVDVMLENDFTGISLLKNLRSKHIKQPAILMTAYTTPTNMIEASKIGVRDVLQKPFTREELIQTVEKYVTKKHEDLHDFKKIDEDFIGSFDVMREVYEKIGQASNNELPVIILGETGTGKELIANLIHKNSSKALQPFIAINCAAIPKELFESQLFGHEKGSFSGADKQHDGLAETVRKGTLFLDEIGELDISLQSKLLRFIETKSFKRVGGNIEIPFNGRIISATNIDLKNAIKNEYFREDLFYRLSMLVIKVPALKDRKEDIPLLVNHFIKKANADLNLNIHAIENDALKMLQERDYDGNIRELKNIIYNLALNAHTDTIMTENIKFEANNTTKIEDLVVSIIKTNGIENAKKSLESLEKIFYEQLTQNCHNLSHLASYLNTSRSTLRKILLKYDINLAEK